MTKEASEAFVEGKFNMLQDFSSGYSITSVKCLNDKHRWLDHCEDQFSSKTKWSLNIETESCLSYNGGPITRSRTTKKHGTALDLVFTRHDASIDADDDGFSESEKEDVLIGMEIVEETGIFLQWLLLHGTIIFSMFF